MKPRPQPRAHAAVSWSRETPPRLFVAGGRTSAHLELTADEARALAEMILERLAERDRQA
jgi:hypothetical protein